LSTQTDPEHNEEKAIKRLVDFKNRSVLEVGCGDGRLTWKYAAAAGRVTGIDPDLDGLRVARVDRPYQVAEKVQFAGGSARWLPFPREKFDIAVLAWSL
jgi:ubiquinone/menaquinone biosynthesis C-methylase UbiE